MMTTYKKMRETFDKAWKQTRAPFEKVQVNYEGKTLDGYFRKPNGPAGKKFPVVIAFQGADTMAEATIMNGGSYGARGMAYFAMDFPGQGGALRLHDLHLPPDTERIAKAIIDYLETRPDVDAKNIGMQGISMGGFGTPRAASGESRIKAAMMSSGSFHLGQDLFDYYPPIQERVRWIIGAKDLADAKKKLAGYTLEGRANRIESAMLIVQSAMVPLEVLRNAVNRMSVMPGQRTLVLASPGFLTMIGSRNEQSVIIDRAIRANVVINSLDVRGLAVEGQDLSKPPIILPAGTGQAQYYSYRQQIEHQEFNAQQDVMAEMAAGTGGTFYHNSNDLDAGFDRVAAAPEYLYVLGFAPKELKMDGSLHALKVSLVKNPEHFDLDSRRSYTAPKHLDDPAEQAKREIQDALFSREELRDIPLELHSDFFKTPEDHAKVTVTTHVDLKALHLRKAEGRNHDDLTVTTALFDNNGNYVAGIQRGVDLRLKDETFDRWMASGIQVQSHLEVKPGIPPPTSEDCSGACSREGSRGPLKTFSGSVSCEHYSIRNAKWNRGSFTTKGEAHRSGHRTSPVGHVRIP